MEQSFCAHGINQMDGGEVAAPSRDCQRKGGSVEQRLLEERCDKGGEVGQRAINLFELLNFGEDFNLRFDRGAKEMILHSIMVEVRNNEIDPEEEDDDDDNTIFVVPLWGLTFFAINSVWW
ncbi:hypothetical protein PanWU01x14_127180 [Parasponia andersonii]|uniref:Uncharacterized protein n=1 Tax=Parasponia andersonii TaxID=3476 RepID=A0A2P5CSF7_PARAD|nr:hypothetical protein PanWU01x14_127180 [Parasponia andersonii]